MTTNRRNSLPCTVRKGKGRASKGLVVCYVVWLGFMIYGMGLWTSAGQSAWVWSLVVVTTTPHRYMQIHTNKSNNIKIIVRLTS